MATPKATQKRAQLKQLIKMSRFQVWPDDQLMDEIEKLYGRATSRTPRTKTAAK